MNSTTIFVCVLFLFIARGNGKHVHGPNELRPKEPRESITELKEPAEEDCRPKPTYVRWDEIRHYLSEYFKLHIPVSTTGVDLIVMRCRHFLAPCKDEDTYCGVDKDNIRKTRIPLYRNGHKYGSVTIEFLEDEQCNCVSKKWYDLASHHDVSTAPVILDAFITHY